MIAKVTRNGLQYRSGVVIVLRRAVALLAAAAAASLAACEGRNPAAVSRQRHPEYYASEPLAAAAEPAPGPAPPVFVAGDAEATGGPLTAGSDEAPVIVVEPPREPAEGTALDLPAALAGAALTIAVNDPVFPPRLGHLFDGDTSTLSRTEDVNPLVMVFRFAEPIALVGVRLFPSYSTYDWSVRPAPEEPRYLLRQAAEEEWSRIDLPEPVETREVRLRIRRLQRDDYVHVNEVELLVAAEANE